MTDVLYPPEGILALLKAVPSFATGWQIATGRLIDTPDKQLVITTTGGIGAEPVVAQDYPSIQIMVRGSKGSGGAQAAYLKALEARNALLSIPSRPIQYPNLSSITAIGHIQDLGRNDRDEPIWSFNLQLIVFYATSGYREDI